MEVGAGGRVKGTQLQPGNAGFAWSGEGRRDFVK